MFEAPFKQWVLDEATCSCVAVLSCSLILTLMLFRLIIEFYHLGYFINVCVNEIQECFYGYSQWELISLVTKEVKSAFLSVNVYVLPIWCFWKTYKKRVRLVFCSHTPFLMWTQLLLLHSLFLSRLTPLKWPPVEVKKEKGPVYFPKKLVIRAFIIYKHLSMKHEHDCKLAIKIMIIVHVAPCATA